MQRSHAISHFADRLHQQARARGAAVCVGLDPVRERLPAALAGLEPVSAIEQFSVGVIDAVAEIAPCIKIQAACFERYRAAGFDAYFRLIAHARRRGLLVIGDAKRGDIGASSAHYAAGLLAEPDGPDALTVNAYLGGDGLEPFLDVAAREGKGLFALVRTSNPGGDAIQTPALADGRSVAEAVADVVAELGLREPTHVGDCGYSLLGAVVGATKSSEIASLRARMPRQVFLVPGFGAQGGQADDVRACFDAEGGGAIITASRSILYPSDSGDDWQAAIAQAARRMADQIAAVAAGES